MYKTQPLEIFLAHQKEVKKMKNKIKTLEQQLKSMNDKIIALEIRSPRPQRNRPSPTDKSDTKKNKNKSKPK
jgi:hypothetical protein